MGSQDFDLGGGTFAERPAFASRTVREPAAILRALN